MGNNTAEITSATNETILHQITKRRTNRNAVAARAGVPSSTFNRKVDGHGDWTVKELGQIAEALDMKLPEVLLQEQGARE
ncbi:hypothetical protein [Arthrobacter sp. StoSoilB22]|uniref:helix-turn-helix domain-containing protein n=1 Tax=Arthrobacter sp. StoSoilB22 TaxID=2830996 RepID=UPI001CC6CC53|nr:hypothetical protein [Arthrobacter sp. StoSoilB22]BCW61905.1 hypothetical protein StoSoilB22_08780 [Arthrobacter sp. StoSoilB22]